MVQASAVSAGRLGASNESLTAPSQTLLYLLHQQALLLREQPPPGSSPRRRPKGGGAATGVDAAGRAEAGAEADTGGPDGNVAAGVISVKAVEYAGAQEESAEDPEDQSPGSEDPHSFAGHPSLPLSPDHRTGECQARFTPGHGKAHSPITKVKSPGT